MSVEGWVIVCDWTGMTNAHIHAKGPGVNVTLGWLRWADHAAQWEFERKPLPHEHGIGNQHLLRYVSVDADAELKFRDELAATNDPTLRAEVKGRMRMYAAETKGDADIGARIEGRKYLPEVLKHL